jgi:predicted RecB family nuclease
MLKVSKSFRNSQRAIILAAVKNSMHDLNLPEIRSLKVKSTKSKTLEGWADVSNGHAKISINRGLKGAELFCVVAHEMVHISQLLSGRLVTAAPDLFIWDGKVTRLTDKKMAKISPRKYRELPWEAEAYAYGDSFL